MAIDVDRGPWRAVTEREQTCAQRRLEIQGAFDGHSLQEPVLGGRGWEKRQSSEQAKVGTADRIEGANASRIAKDRLKAAPSRQPLLRQPCGLGRASRRHEVRGSQLQEGGNEEPTTRARGREATFAPRRDVMVDVVPGDDAGAWLARTVEAFELLLGEPSR